MLRAYLIRLAFVLVLVQAACSQGALSFISVDFVPGVTLSAERSELQASCTFCPVGHSIRVVLAAKDTSGMAYTRTDFTVNFDDPIPAALQVSKWSVDSSGTMSAEVKPLVVGPMPPLVVLVNGERLPPLQLSAFGVRAATGLAFVAPPATGRQNTPLSPPLTVALVDEDGVTITDGDDASAEVTLDSARSSSAILTGTTSATARTGKASFTDLASATVGDLRLVAKATLASGQVLVANSPVIAIDGGVDARVKLSFGNAESGSFSVSDPQAMVVDGQGVSLREVVHSDSDAAHFSLGSGTGVQWDGDLSALRLGDSGGCDGMKVNCASLDPSWTPRWPALVGYWPLDGTGSLADGAKVPGLVGAPLTARNSNGTGMQFGAGKVKGALTLDGIDDYLVLPSDLLTGPLMTVMAWIRRDRTIQNERFFDFAPFRGHNPGSWFCVTAIGQAWAIGLGSGGSGFACLNGQTGLGTWSHLVATFDGHQASLFVNGNLVGTTAVGRGFSPFFYARSLLVGASNFLSDPSLAGGVDELAVWSEALTADEIASIYSRQRARLAGTYVSRPIDLLSGGQAVTSFGWQTPQPFLKPLPDRAAEEAPFYPGTAAGLQAAVSGHWRLDEAGPSVAGGFDFADSSGLGRHLSFLNDAPANLARGAFGVFGPGVALRNSAFIQTEQAVEQPQTFSHQLWFQTGLGQAVGALVGATDSSGTAGGESDRAIYVDTSGQLRFGIYPGQQEVVVSPQVVTDMAWHHIVASLGPQGQKLYLDGRQVAGDASQSSTAGGMKYIKIGFIHDSFVNDWPAVAGPYTSAFISEGATWSRQLLANEVTALFRRGSNRLSHQLRGCSQVDCSDEPPWQGPDGTAQTTFSELDNRLGSTVLPTSPLLPVSIVNARAVQYRSFFESDDSQNLCAYTAMGQVGNACSPELLAVALGPSHVSAAMPSVISLQPIPYLNLRGIAATLGPAGCPGGLRLLLSADSTRWWTWQAGSWRVTSAGAEVATPIAALTGEVLDAFAISAGAGALSLRLFLPSNGTSPCAVEAITMDLRR